MAVFHLSANLPVPKEMLTILVMVLPTLSKMVFSSLVGIASHSHDFVGISLMIFITLTSVMGLNESRVAHSMGVGM